MTFPPFPPIKRGDLPWIALTAGVCFLIGAILLCVEMTFIIASVGGGGWFDDEKVSRVRYQQNLFDCTDAVHQGNVGHTGDEHVRDSRHEKACDEIRRIAEEAAAAAVEKYHPRPVN